MEDERVIADRVSEFLTQKFLEFREANGWQTSLNEFIRELNKRIGGDVNGLNNSTFSTWMRKERIPQGEHNYMLGKLFGPEYFDVRGIPRPMPDFPLLKRIVNMAYYDLDLNEEDLEATLGYMEGLRDARNGARQKAE